MDINSKLKVLEQIYTIYDNFAVSLDLACKKYCDHCCTSGVTLTTLEGYKIIEGLKPEARMEVVRKIRAASETRRFRPGLTTNRLARLYTDGVDPGEEEGNFDLPACALLSGHQCPIYELRPFGCRCLVSRHNCGEIGYAEIDEFVLSVNTVFLQTIEHIDADGCTGNLVDILLAMSIENKREAYCSSALHCSANRLVPNQPLQVLMIPPEHRAEMEPILKELREITA